MPQVLRNLLGTALRHTPAGGQISLTAAQQDRRVLLTVQDTGTGIPPDELPRTFDRLYRGDEAREGGGGESGLGLAISRSLSCGQTVDRNAGSLLVVGSRHTIRRRGSR